MPEAEPTTTVTTYAPRSLMSRFAERFQIEPDKLAATLKATAFASDKPITNEQLAMLVIVANQYNLNPFLRQIYAYPDRGRIVPVVGVDGWISLVQSHAQFDGWEFAWDEKEGAMTCTIYRKDRNVPTVVTEYLSECRRGTDPWKSMPRRMMRNRSIAQCARLAFGFTGIHTDDEAETIIEKENASTKSVHPTDTATRVKRVLRKEPVEIVKEITDEIPEVDIPSELPDYLDRLDKTQNDEERNTLMRESLTVLNAADFSTLSNACRVLSTTPETDNHD